MTAIGTYIGVWLSLWLINLAQGQYEKNIGSNVIRTGAVLSSSGFTDEMQEARRGYQLFIDIVNSLNNNSGMSIPVKNGTPSYNFLFEFQWRDDNSDAELHNEQVIQLLDEEKIHVLFGSHPNYALQETKITNNRSVFNLHCCVGPDLIYEQNFQYVFGIQVSNLKYTELVIRRLSLQDIRSVAILYDIGNTFTTSTCEAAYQQVQDLLSMGDGFSLEIFNNYNSSQKGDIDKSFSNFAMDVKKRNIEAVIACFFEEDGKALVNAIHNEQYPLKAFFLTVGPTKQEWIDSFDPPYRSDCILSAGQWHKDLRLADSFFGKTSDFTKLYREKYSNKTDPTYVSAGAAAMGYVLYMAFQGAFVKCDLSLTNGDIDQILFNSSAVLCDDQNLFNGYDRLRMALKYLDINTFFGRVSFDYYQRNTGMDPVILQVIKNKDDLTESIKSVLPEGIATAKMIFPAVNYYKPNCSAGYYKNNDEFNPCITCSEGEISFRENSEYCESCNLGTYNDFPGQSTCKACPEGTSTLMRGAVSILDCICEPGYYHPNGSNNGNKCYPCPDGAQCNGNISLPIPKYGYWADKAFVSTVYECDPPEICLGGENFTCKNGYTGRLCMDCESGNFNLFQSCHKCITTGSTIIALIFLFIIWYVINVIISRKFSSLDMILTWVQLANIIGDLPLNWPSKLNFMFGLANILDFDVDILQPSCLINWSFLQNLIVQLLLPFIMSGMAAIGFLSSCIFYQLSLWHRGDRVVKFTKTWLRWLIKVPENCEELKERWDKTLATFLSSVDVTYVTMCKYCFDTFKCETIAGISVLKASPDVKCNTEKHRVSMFFGLVGILFYIIGYVLFISWKLFSLNKKKRFSDPVDHRRFGFVYDGFEIKYFYTPILISCRRMLFVFILVFINNPAFQAGAIAVIINASLMIHIYTAPYIDVYLDVLFSFLLVALMFEAFGGLMFSSNILSDTDRIILEWIVLFAVFVLMAVFTVIFFLEIKKIFEVRYLKQIHIKYILSLNQDNNNGDNKKSFKSKILSNVPLINNLSLGQCQLEVNHELLETFDPSFVYKALKNKPEYIKYWHKLTNILNEYMSDISEISYLSMDPRAKFWRKLVDRFPELVEFLAVADKDARDEFLKAATNLYMNFYLKNKELTLPIISVLNWRDYAPMAQWLAISSCDDREFFVRFIITMFDASKNTKMAEYLNSQLESGGNNRSLQEDQSSGKSNYSSEETGIFVRELSKSVKYRLQSKLSQRALDYVNSIQGSSVIPIPEQSE